ncbi:hypothetical protein OG339_48430 (plasmid) [Streptosporangium sp. NBC_01495]|uniref:hypothetical protein n=1 Tax=Streptosporangium sp. NBC_01495 TaxID=2903899 RepID=UPI002E35B360|nr:hypothetical protein [Streptosporangium sp. NBC_01495]
MKCYVKGRDTVQIVASYSEAACFARIAGKVVTVTLVQRRDWLAVAHDTEHGYGLTLGEIGFRCDDADWYIPAESIPPSTVAEEVF